jgi:hypothetical protein
MSVRADQRSESSLLFYKIARELRREISCDLLNKFNSKNETFTTEENTVVNQKEQYPAYMVDFIRKDILGLLQKLMQYISIANSIYPACVLEVDKRRLLQDYAIGTAEALQNELEYCADVFPDTLRCLLHYADEIDHLIKVLRRWKKSNAKILKSLQRAEPISANFCNCNNNGNANYNSASNSDNGVRFDLADKQSDIMPDDEPGKGGL